jgi:hypothetical protein
LNLLGGITRNLSYTSHSFKEYLENQPNDFWYISPIELVRMSMANHL